MEPEIKILALDENISDATEIHLNWNIHITGIFLKISYASLESLENECIS